MDKYVKVSSAKLVNSGEEFFSLLEELIRSARISIHLQTYIFSEDSTGKSIAHALKEAAQRGVKIYIVADGYGSKELSKTFVADLQNAGIHFRFFSASLFGESLSIVRRLHHKIVVVDGDQTLVGGINIGDKYHGNENTRAWLDFAVLIKGSCGEMIQDLCEAIYKRKNYSWRQIKWKTEKDGIQIRFRRNDSLRGRNEVYRSYKRAVKKADASITIIGSYFMPGFSFLRSLKNAVQRGVKVNVLMGSISDIPLFHNAEKYLYDYLLRNGIHVYEWNESVLHGKAMIVDGQWCTIGSYNLNNLSKYKTIELNVDILDEEFSTLFHQQMDCILAEKCTNVTVTEYQRKTNIFSRIKNGFAYFYYRLFMILISSTE